MLPLRFGRKLGVVGEAIVSTMPNTQRGRSHAKQPWSAANSSDSERDDYEVYSEDGGKCYKKRQAKKQVSRKGDGGKGRDVDRQYNVSEEETAFVEQQVLKENSVISNHVQFLKAMRGIIPRDDALSRLLTLICNGPQLANGEVFSDISLMQTTLDFVIGLIKDPSLNLRSINNVVCNIKDGLPLYYVRVLKEKLYCKDNFVTTGFTVGKLNAMKQSVHLKYCVSALMSTLFTVCFSNRFRSKATGKLEFVYNNNRFHDMLTKKNLNFSSMLSMNIQSFLSLLCMYGHVYWYDEIFFKEYWKNAFDSNVSEMGSDRREENKKLMLGSFGAVETMIYNLLDEVGNCITYYAWLCWMEKVAAKESLVTTICETIELEIEESREAVSALLKNHTSAVNSFMEEMKYCIVHHFGKNKCSNLKIMIAQRLNVVLRD